MRAKSAHNNDKFGVWMNVEMFCVKYGIDTETLARQLNGVKDEFELVRLNDAGCLLCQNNKTQTIEIFRPERHGATSTRFDEFKDPTTNELVLEQKIDPLPKIATVKFNEEG